MSRYTRHPIEAHFQELETQHRIKRLVDAGPLKYGPHPTPTNSESEERENGTGILDLDRDDRRAVPGADPALEISVPVTEAPVTAGAEPQCVKCNGTKWLTHPLLGNFLCSCAINLALVAELSATGQQPQPPRGEGEPPGFGIPCVKCGLLVEPERGVYAHPTCYTCLPPPEPLPIVAPPQQPAAPQLSEALSCLVHAFGDSGRKEGVRELVRLAAALESQLAAAQAELAEARLALQAEQEVRVSNADRAEAAEAEVQELRADIAVRQEGAEELERILDETKAALEEAKREREAGRG